jgi:hypothetical protein
VNRKIAPLYTKNKVRATHTQDLLAPVRELDLMSQNTWIIGGDCLRGRERGFRDEPVIKAVGGRKDSPA